MPVTYLKGGKPMPGWATHAAGTVGLDAVTADKVAIKKVDWLWPGRVARGTLAIVEGDPGQGKSAICLDLAARLSVGGPLPDGTACEPATSVVLSAEDSAETTLVPRLVAAGADLGKITIVNGLPSGEPFRIPDHMPLLRAKVIETGARLVVVGPLYGFLDPKMQGDAQVRKALNPLAALAEATGAAVLVVRHLTKKSGRAMYQGGGSIAVVALARTAMRVDADPEHPGRHVLAVVKCNLGPRAPSLRYRLVEKIVAPDEDQGLTAPAVEWLGETSVTADELAAGPGGAQGGAVQEAATFLKQVLKDGPMPPTEVFALGQQDGHSKASIRRASNLLKVEKVQVHEGGKIVGWRWRLPGSG